MQNPCVRKFLHLPIRRLEELDGSQLFATLGCHVCNKNRDNPRIPFRFSTARAIYRGENAETLMPTPSYPVQKLNNTSREINKTFDWPGSGGWSSRWGRGWAWGCRPQCPENTTTNYPHCTEFLLKVAKLEFVSAFFEHFWHFFISKK